MMHIAVTTRQQVQSARECKRLLRSLWGSTFAKQRILAFLLTQNKAAFIWGGAGRSSSSVQMHYGVRGAKVF